MTCFACGKPLENNRRCSSCNIAYYCDRDCQRADWPRHKPLCAQWKTTPPSADDIAGKSSLNVSPTEPNRSKFDTDNGYIIRAQSSSDKPVLDNIAAQIEAWHFDPIGNEAEEKRQIMRREGWTDVIEVGKFYDHAGTDKWYYFVYGPSNAYNKNSGKPKNESASLVCYEPVYGDVIVVTSGPLDSGWPEEIRKSDLVTTMEWHKKNDRATVFHERERSRFMRKMGLGDMDRAGTLPPHIFQSTRI
jgi:hypothetical protein